MRSFRFYFYTVTAWLGVFVAALSAQAEDGYRLWLRYNKIASAEVRNAYSRQITEIVVQGRSASALAIRSELSDGVGGLLAGEVPVSEDISRDGALVAGTPSTSRILAGLGWDAELKALGEEGYIIRSVAVKDRPVIAIGSLTERGALYGAFHLLRLLQTGEDIQRLALSESPAFQRRILNHWDNLNRTVERGYAGKSLWKWEELPGTLDGRYVDYARANASLGINGAVLNNVNAKPEQLRSDYIEKAAALANVFRPYGIRIYLSVNFASPKRLDHLPTADPHDPEVQRWWKEKANEIYARIPDFGGFLVKANSEGQPGPQDYKRTHADGANMLADALAPHGGIVIWRAFVYNSPKIDPDRSKRAYLEFMPLDGQFRSNVVLQAKTGPVDFQPREPFHPLFGAMRKTAVIPELQITQENMGHSTDLVYLAPMWKEFLDSQTGRRPLSTVREVVTSHKENVISGVANTGSDRNWCGHHFAQANWYAFGRLAWNPQLSAEQIAKEWNRRTWGNDPAVLAAAWRMMRGSWEACVNYEMPLGLHHLMEAGGHYDPRPETVNKSAPEYSAWYYHKADANGIGFNRTAAGSDAISQYAPSVARRFGNPAACPEELLLWFHHVDWDYRMRTGRTVWEELCFRYNDGVDYVREMQAEWAALRGRVDPSRFEAVSKRLEQQLRHAIDWRDTCLSYFQSVNHKDLPIRAGNKQ